MARKQNQQPVITSLVMSNEDIGNHGLTYRKIFNLIDGIFRNKFMIKDRCEDAAKLLYIARAVKIKDSTFYKVRLGDDINVLITYDYLGPDNHDYVYDFAVINGNPTLFIFADSLLNPKVPEFVRTFRLYSIFTTLTVLYAKQEYMNLVGTVCETIAMYAPMVMTIRLIETFYNRKFDMDRDFKAYIFGDGVMDWFNDEALEIIHSCNDSALLSYGALVEHINMYR